MKSADAQAMAALPDGRLIERCRQGDEEAFRLLLLRYQPLVRSQVAGWHLRQQDAEDFYQEAWISLLQSVRRYDPARGVPFSAFAAHCMQNRLTSAARRHAAANRLRTVSLDSDDFPDALYPACDPEQQIVERQQTQTLLNRLRVLLSAKERQILLQYLQGLTYEQMACQLEISEKSVDNALCRIRRKLRTLQNETACIQ